MVHLLSRRLAIVLTCAFWIGAAAAQPQETIRAFDQQTIEMLGSAIYEQDRRAALATDILLAGTDEASRREIRGWVFRSDRPDAVIRFVRVRAGTFEAAYDVDDRDGALSLVVPPDRSLSAHELAQFKARNLALHNIARPCSDRYNAVILRDHGSDRWLVWMLAAHKVPNLIQIGGHYRFTISADGETIVSRDALSMSCFVMDKNQAPANARAEWLFMTHLVSNTPVETHVFLSLLHRMPFMIGTPDRMMWEVKDGHIRKVGPMPAQQVQPRQPAQPAQR